MVLTKAGSILGPIATVLGYVMDILFRFTSSFGVFNVGLCIILFTIVMKTLMIPLTIKQQKTTKLMSVMNPEIQAIQKKYKGKSDQESMQRQNVEIQAVYEKYGTSMTGGCLPLLIQMPILLALYRVIYNIPAYVPSVRVYFDNVVTPLMGQADYAQKLQEITNIATACGGKLDKFDFTNANRLVDMLYKFSTSQWGELQALFPAISDVIGQNAAVVERMNTFLGLNMAEAPGWVPSFAWIIPVLAAVSQWFSTKLMSGNQPSTSADAENPMAQSMKTMTTTMPLFSAFICITMPAGLGIYWIATSVVTIIQQLIVNAYMDKVNIDDMIAKNLEKVNKKRAKQGLPPAVSQWFSTKLMSGNQPSTSADAENPMAQSMKTMTTTMPLFSAFICITMPAGLGIYWIATSVVTIIQQLIVNAYMDKVNIDDMIAKNLEKVNKKRAKQGLPPAKVTQNATASLKAIKAEEEKEKAAEEVKKEKIAKQIEESSKYYNTNAKPGSLASKAAMVQKYNEAHDKRK